MIEEHTDLFGAIGAFVYRARVPVITVMVAIFVALGVYGIDIGDHLSQGGWYDDNSESARASRLSDEKFGQDTKSDVILFITATDPGSTVESPAIADAVFNQLAAIKQDHPDKTVDIFSLWGVWNHAAPQTWPKATPDGHAPAAIPLLKQRLESPDGKHTFVSIGIQGKDDTERVNNYRSVRDAFTFSVPGAKVETTGLLAVTDAINETMGKDVHRMELIAVPLTALIMFFVFGGVVAAILPAIVGGLAILGGNGLIKLLTEFTEVSSFAQPVVSLVGLGIAVDYGLFMVSRFREELAEGYPIDIAVRRTVQSAGRTVVYSALLVVVSIAGVLLFPQGFLRSVAYACGVSIAFAAFISLTVLPAMLSFLGHRVDALSLDTILRFLRLNVIADLPLMRYFKRTRSREQVMDGFWGKLSAWVMRHPVKLMVPVLALLLLLILPALNIKFAGISEKYLPPDNPTRLGLQHFEETFPKERTEQLKIMVLGGDPQQLNQVASKANEIKGFTGQFSFPDAANPDPSRLTDGVAVATNSLINRDTAAEAVKQLRALKAPPGTTIWIFGTPALEQDSIDAVFAGFPLMGFLLIVITTVMMFLAFGSVVLPVKAVILSVLSLGSTLGVLTWIFQEGHGAGLLNFTPYPLMAVVLALLVALVYGLSSDYEVFLLARTVEARGRGLSTEAATCEGAASGGRVITAAALVLLVVASAFGFSELVMMKYLAFGLIAALLIDVTAIRMILVPATMKLLGDENWWAPRWMKRFQERLGLGEIAMPDERHLIPAGAGGAAPAPDIVRTQRPQGWAEPGAPQQHPVPGQLAGFADSAPTQPIYVIDDEGPVDQQEYWSTHDVPPAPPKSRRAAPPPSPAWGEQPQEPLPTPWAPAPNEAAPAAWDAAPGDYTAQREANQKARAYQQAAEESLRAAGAGEPPAPAQPSAPARPQTPAQPTEPEKPQAGSGEDPRFMSAGRHRPGTPGTLSPWDLLRKARGGE
ncbi:MMPL domain protein [Segniliparus rotundus DSM 44985]|uniref:MMPL domain protein n=1 Tax=Segniliparus rotundus (strain ATCC BAA-972 / CDC 1076 / CIP 108378 / DSM 44985 / JCM 13578) TaxID=640132 RepID=D6ZDK8_SEGRD|nr:MMPL family transporter [Segniliparus rotundus]ADG99265.1 MMPL domain protein [Segniliparus rotundus DSM 44985]